MIECIIYLHIEVCLSRNFRQSQWLIVLCHSWPLLRMFDHELWSNVHHIFHIVFGWAAQNLHIVPYERQQASNRPSFYDLASNHNICVIRFEKPRRYSSCRSQVKLTPGNHWHLSGGAACEACRRGSQGYRGSDSRDV